MAASLTGIQGMLLEEAILYFLGTSLYRPVTFHHGDPTLRTKPTGLCVVGQGALHQVDAIADFIIKPPFSPVQRLLVEAKFHHKDASGYAEPTGLDVIRNAVGVLKDASEYWYVSPMATSRARHGQPLRPIQRPRYHYQYAVISSSGFTLPAQDYAFAQDISLIQVGHSLYFRPVIDAINKLSAGNFNTSDPNHLDVDQVSLRSIVRERLYATGQQHATRLPMPEQAEAIIEQFIAACHAIKLGVLATPGSGSPVLLVANPGALNTIERVISEAILDGNDKGDPSSWRVHRDREIGGWIVKYDGTDLFSVDIPPRFFRLVVEHQLVLSDNQMPEDLSIRVAFTDIDNQLGRSPRAGLGTKIFKVKWREVKKFLDDLEEGKPGEGGPPMVGPF